MTCREVSRGVGEDGRQVRIAGGTRWDCGGGETVVVRRFRDRRTSWVGASPGTVRARLAAGSAASSPPSSCTTSSLSSQPSPSASTSWPPSASAAPLASPFARFAICMRRAADCIELSVRTKA